jgi:hypothetical protein
MTQKILNQLHGLSSVAGEIYRRLQQHRHGDETVVTISACLHLVKIII